jgi:phage RecT family recombinase
MNDKLVKANKLREDVVLLDPEEMEFEQLLHKKRDGISKLLTKGVDFDWFTQQTIIAVHRNRDLMQCTRTSLFYATLDCAVTGLDYTPAKGWAYMVPFKNVAQFMPGYPGLIELHVRTGKITMIDAEIVYDNDEFEYMKGTNPGIIHKPNVNGYGNKIVGAYAIAFFSNNMKQMVYMPFPELQRIRNTAKTQKIWNLHEHEMYRKVPVRRLSKYLPISTMELAFALECDNKVNELQDAEEARTPEYTVEEAMAQAEVELGIEQTVTEKIDALKARAKSLTWDDGTLFEFIKTAAENPSLKSWDEIAEVDANRALEAISNPAEIERITGEPLTQGTLF